MPAPPLPALPGSAASPLIPIAVAGGLLLLSSLGAAMFAFSSSRSSPPQPVVPVQPPVAVEPLSAAPARAKPLSIADLAALTGGGGWKEVDSKPPSPPTAFDAMASLPWARSLAQAWRSDAVFVRAQLEGLTSNALIDTTHQGFEVRYEFRSPKEIAIYEEKVKTELIKVPYELTLKMSDGKVLALVYNDAPNQFVLREMGEIRRFHNDTKPLCTTARALERARKGPKGLPQRPFYTAYVLTHGDTPSWHFGVVGDSASSSYFDTSECAK